MKNQHKFIILITLFLSGLILNLVLGSVLIPGDIWSQLISGQKLPDAYRQLLTYRILKAATAIITGMGLATGGLLMQSIFKNPIAGPYVLGTSSAAGLGVAILILGSSISGFSYISGFSIAMAAVIGSITGLLFIIFFYQKLPSTSSLLITGLMLGIFSGAIISILSYFSKANALQKFVFWGMGNLGNQSVTAVIIMLVSVFTGIIAGIILIKPLNALLLGDEYALSMGINIRKTTLLIILLTGLIVGSITAFVGPIAFVGLASPHISRIFFKTNLHQILLPAVILTGAVIMLVCDTIAQVPGSSISLPINSITAIFGAPLVVYLITKNN
jgi:iron complex transport system permease protein